MSDDDQGRQKRRHKRVTAREVTALTERDGEPVSYSVVNLSLGGVLLTGAPPLTPGEELELQLKLKGAQAVTVRGQVVHARAEGLGVAFAELARTDVDAMEQLIAAVEAQVLATPPPLPPRKGADDLPPMAPRPDQGVFDTHDPRPPRSGAPDEREDYLRTLVKNRDDVVRRGRVALAGIAVEADGLRAAAVRLKARLEAANAQHALTEVALTSAREQVEKLRDAQSAERAGWTVQLDHEQRKTLEAIGTVSGLESRVRKHELELKAAVEEAAAARREAAAMAQDVASLRKAREELHGANRKAMEATAQLKREKEARERAEQGLQAANAQLEALKAEVQKLRGKLVNAENALERAAAASRRLTPASRSAQGK